MQQFNVELSLEIDKLHVEIERLNSDKIGLIGRIKLLFLRWQLRRLEREIPA